MDKKITQSGRKQYTVEEKLKIIELQQSHKKQGETIGKTSGDSETIVGRRKA